MACDSGLRTVPTSEYGIEVAVCIGDILDMTFNHYHWRSNYLFGFDIDAQSLNVYWFTHTFEWRWKRTYSQ